MPPRVLLSASSPLVTLWQISHLTKYVFAQQIFFCWHFFWMLWTVYATTNLAASTFYNTEANISTPNMFPLIIFWHILCTLCLASCRPLWEDGMVDYLQKIKSSTFLEPSVPQPRFVPMQILRATRGIKKQSGSSHFKGTLQELSKTLPCPKFPGEFFRCAHYHQTTLQ